MATRGKAISVKIATPKVIKALEVALAKLEKDYTSQAEISKVYDKAIAKWKKEVFAIALKHTDKAVNVRVNTATWKNSTNVDFDLEGIETLFPAEPERQTDVLHKHDYNSQKEEISNAIRILKMTDEEVVNTSTYNAVARYL